MSVGEVFIKTHTRPDGTYVDKKAEKIIQNYEKNIQDKLAELEAENSSLSDCELSVDDYTSIFLQVTVYTFHIYILSFSHDIYLVFFFYFFSPLTRIHEELLMELETSRRLSSMASARNQEMLHHLWHCKTN